MSGVQLVRHGGPETLVWSDDIAIRAPGPGEALVKVLAAGVNNTDINTRVGWYAKEVTGATDASGAVTAEEGGFAGALNFPLIQGGDLCGRVVALGEGDGPAVGARVTAALNQPMPEVGARVIAPNVQPGSVPGRSVGYRVIGSDYDGCFAQYCTVPVDQLYDVTDAPLTDVEIAAMPCAYGTAEGLLSRAALAEGERALITGASGGVGMAAVQLAKIRAAHVTGVSSAPKAQAVRDAGADEVVDRDAVPTAQSYDVVIDLVGGPGWGTLIDALVPGGRYAVSGAIAGPIVEADLRTIYLNDLSILGSTYQPREVFSRLVDLMRQGAVRPLVSQTYPLAQIHRAQEDFAAKTYPGKLVLIPPGVA
ncbi:MAG: zinc-binding dehydrogenase [Pseudomonadota bacterium]